MQNEPLLNETPAGSAFTPELSPLEALVGEGKKYATVEDLAKGALHAQNHITTLEAEAAAREQELASRAAVEELLRKNASDQTLLTPPAPSEQPPAETTPPTSVPEVPKQELADLIREVMSKDQAEHNKASNLEKSVSGLDKVTGSREKTQQLIAAKAAELKVSAAFLQNIAETSPAAFFTTMNVVPPSQPNTNVAPSSNDVNTQTLQNQANSQRASQPGTKEYYDNIRKNDPVTFKRVQKQMYADAQKDPDKFFGRKLA